MFAGDVAVLLEASTTTYPELSDAPDSLGCRRALFYDAGVPDDTRYPKEPVKILQKAFKDTMKHPESLAEATAAFDSMANLDERERERERERGGNAT